MPRLVDVSTVLRWVTRLHGTGVARRWWYLYLYLYPCYLAPRHLGDELGRLRTGAVLVPSTGAGGAPPRKIPVVYLNEYDKWKVWLGSKCTRRPLAQYPHTALYFLA